MTALAYVVLLALIGGLAGYLVSRALRQPPDPLPQDFRCACGQIIATERGHISAFMATVPTRARPVDGIDVKFTITEYACVCSRACFDEVRATWPRNDKPIPGNALKGAIDLDGEKVVVQWGNPVVLR